MPDDMIEIQTDSGAMPVTITRPDGPGPHPLVVIYMDAAGVRGVLHEVASRVAAAGYLTALPDVYYRLEPERRPDPERLRTGPQEELPRMLAAARSVEDAVVVADTRVMVEQLAARESIHTGGWGCIGFCMGGRLGLRAAAAFGREMRAASLLHPSRLVTDEPDSPHRAVDSVRAELYLGMGGGDHVTPVDTIPPLTEALERGDIEYRIEIFAHADHGFMMPGAPVYDRNAAEAAWRGTFELLKRAFPAAG